MITRLVIFSLTAVLSAGMIQAQQPPQRSGYQGHTLVGRVINTDNGMEVTGAVVKLEGRNRRLRTVTDTNGFFRFVDLEPDFYRVEVSHNGYETSSEQFDLNFGPIRDGTVRMKPLTKGQKSLPGGIVPVQELMIPEDARDAFNEGFKLLYEEKNAKKCIKVFQRAVSIYPDFAEAYLHMGVAFVQTKKLKDAKEALERVIALMPENARAHGVMGMVHEREGRETSAVEEYRRAIELDDRLWEAHFSLGKLFVSRQLWGEADRHVRRAHELKPEDPNTHLIYYKLCIGQENFAVALQEIDEIIENFPNNPTFANLSNVRERLSQVVHGNPD